MTSPRTTRIRPRSPAPAAIGPPADPQQLMVRRVAAVGIGVVIVLLLVFGINGCLQGRKEQSLKNYNRDVSDDRARLRRQRGRRSSRRSSSGGTSPSTDVQSEINQLRFRAQDLTKQAEGLDVPGEMRPAQRNLLLSLSLIQEAMSKVAEKLPAALSRDSATAVPAVKGIAGEMQAFTAADVVYSRRTAALILQVLDENSIGGQVDPELELPAEPRLAAAVDRRQADRLGGRPRRRRRRATEPAPGAHGHGLIVRRGRRHDAAPGRVEHADGPSTSDVQRDGSPTRATTRRPTCACGCGFAAPASRSPAQEVVDQTQPKTETTVAIKLDEPVPIGEAVTITAEVLPVNGEKQTTNNSQSYPTLFRRG